MSANYRPAMTLAQDRLRSLDAAAVARLAGARLLRGEAGTELRLELLGRQYRVALPSAAVYDLATGAEAGVSTTLVILHYLATADGSPPRGEWMPFRGLPGGDVYERAFRQQCLAPLVATFGHDAEAFRAAAESLGGTRAEMGDASYLFQSLPRVSLAGVLWLADDEQPAEANLLLDAVAPRYLPTEDLAALCRMVAFGLIGARRRIP